MTPDVLWELEGPDAEESGLLTLHRGGETFADLGGLDAIKSFCTRAFGLAVVLDARLAMRCC